jgi:hypothetical protein
MKKLVILILIATALFSCKSTQSKNKVNPINIDLATYQNWYGGREGSRGIKIEINGVPVLQNCTYQTIYFKDKKAEIHTTSKDKNIQLTANINTGYKPEDRMLSSDSNQEYKNKPPVKPKYSNLGKDQAVIEYIYKGKLKSFKIILKKKKDLFFA